MNVNTMTPTEGAPRGPGAQLRQARLDLKLAPENVAKILRLSPKQITALENDDYAGLPGPTYVRGYLRSYAQLLGLAPEKIVDIYNAVRAAEAPANVSEPPAPAQVTSNDLRVKMVTGAVVAGVLALSALWWLGRDKGGHDRPPAPIAYQTESGAVITEPPALPLASGRSAEAPSPSIPDAGTSAPGPATTAAPKAVAVSPAETTAAPKPAVAMPGTAGPRMQLTLRFDKESWVDVRDAQQNKLLYDTVAAGKVINLQGVAPVSVFLGNVDGVRLEVNGQAYDTARHRRGPIARFTVGETAPLAGGLTTEAMAPPRTPVGPQQQPVAEKKPAATAAPAPAIDLRPAVTAAPAAPR